MKAVTHLNRGLVVLLTVLAVMATFALHGRPAIGIDDANIFFSYAENLADGSGITFSGNGEPVEGVTSMLWMLISAFCFALRINEVGVLLVSIVLLCLTHVQMLAIIRRVVGTRSHNVWLFELLYLGLVLSSPSHVTWNSITLMDTALWGALVAVLLRVAIFPPEGRVARVAALGLYALAPMVRPEAMLVVPAILTLSFFSNAEAKSGAHGRYLMASAAVFVLSLGGLILFRMHYFGYPLPNTYYAKVSSDLGQNISQGWQHYVWQYLRSGGLIQAGVFVALVYAAGAGRRLLLRLMAWRKKSEGLSASEMVGCTVVLLLVIPVVVGGDHFKMFRFCQPAYPLICLSVVLLVGRIATACKGMTHPTSSGSAPYLWRWVTLCVVGSIWLLDFAHDDSWLSLRQRCPLKQEFALAESGMVLGRTLNQFFAECDKPPTIGAFLVGGVGRGYDGPTMDLLGLNYPQMAHHRGDRQGMKNHTAFSQDVFFANEPHILVAEPPPPGHQNCYNTWTKGLLDQPRFVQTWRYGAIFSESDPSLRVNAFVLSEALETSLNGVGFVDLCVWDNGWQPVAR